MVYELFSLQTLFKPRFLCDSKYVSGVSITDAQDKRDINIVLFIETLIRKLLSYLYTTDFQFVSLQMYSQLKSSMTRRLGICKEFS
jgi:hypothetical protein